MSVERFDQVARLLAQGVSRRQIIKGFAAGLGASLFSTFGLAATPAYRRMAHAAPNGDGNFLPYIIGNGRGSDAPSICSVASTCDNKVYCSEQGTQCRCLQSAEGVIRCGEVPSCSAQRCTSSADCANLGADYFCDSVGSGCCGDDEQRCIAPCQAEASCPTERICGDECCAPDATCQDGVCVPPPDGPCPEDRVCGESCCPPDTTCQNGACIDVVDGTWTGTLTHEGQSIGVRYVLTRDDYAIEGRFLMEDPVSKEFLETGPVTGEYYDAFASLYLDSGSVAAGDLKGNTFTGEFTFAQFDGEEPLTATLAMTRA